MIGLENAIDKVCENDKLIYDDYQHIIIIGLETILLTKFDLRLIIR